MAPRFRIGDRVYIDDRKERNHHRVPGYVKGRVGVIERVCKAYGRPESLARGDPRPQSTTLYRVRIQQTRLWPDYEGNPRDTLDVDIFEHWLRPAITDAAKTDRREDGHGS